MAGNKCKSFLSRFFSRYYDGWMLAAFAGLGGIASLLAGQDVSFEPFLHTLYPVHALWSGRIGMDVAAAGAGPAVNPLLFIPHYIAFVKLNHWPLLSLFLRGVPYGLFMFFAWKICTEAFRDAREKFFVWAVAALSVTGSASLGQIGRGNGAMLLASVGLWACYLFFCSSRPSARKYAFFTAAFAAGLNIGALPVLAGLAAASLAVRPRGKNGWAATVGYTLLGFSIPAAVSAWYSWRVTGGWESFWLSVWPKGWAFAASPLAVKWEMPLSWREWALLPFLRTGHSLPGYLLDPRLAGGIIGTFILLGKRFWGERTERLQTEFTWCAFFVGAYVCWLAGFRDEFSSIVLEFTSVLLLGRCVLWLAGARWGALLAVAGFLLVPPTFPEGRPAPEESNFAFFKEPVLSAAPLVLLGGHLSGLVPFLPQDARYAGGVWFDPADYPPSKQIFLHRLNRLPSGYYSHRFDGKIRAAVRAQKGDIYALFENQSPALEASVWRRYGVEFAGPAEECQPLYWGSGGWQKEMLLCRMKKTEEQ